MWSFQSHSHLCSNVSYVADWSLLAVTYKKTMAWFSPRAPSRVNARRAKSSASPAALPSFAPSGPFVAEVYVFKAIKACDESLAVGKPTWNLQNG